MKKTLILAENILNNRDQDYIKSIYNPGSCELIALDLETIYKFSQDNLNFKTCDDFLNYNARSKIGADCVNFSRCWYESSTEFMYHGIDLAKVIEVPLMFALFELKEMQQLLKIILDENTQIETFYFIGLKSSGDIAKRMLRARILDREINFRFKLVKEKIDFKGKLKSFFSVIFSNIFKIDCRVRRGKKSILFYECLDKVSDIPAVLSGKYNCTAVYPVFSRKKFTLARKDNISYRTLGSRAFGGRNKSKVSLRNDLGVKLKSFFEICGNCNSQVFKTILNEIDKNVGKFCYLIELLDKTMQKFDLVVTCNDTQPVEKILTLIAKKHNIPTMVVQHGVTSGGETALLNGSSVFGIGFLPLISDYMAIAGPITHEWLIANGVKKENLKITGMPLFDKYFDSCSDFQTDKKELLRHFCLDEKKPLLVFVGQHSNKKSRFPGYHLTPFEIYSMINILGIVVATLKGFNFIVKLHPASQESEKIYENILKDCGVKNCSVIKNYSTYSLLSVSDLVITPWSTAGFESLLLNKPLITLNFSQSPDKMPYAEKKAARNAHSEKDLQELLVYFLGNKNLGLLQADINNFIRQYNDTNNKTASENVRELIYKILGDYV